MENANGLILRGFRYDDSNCLFAKFYIRNKRTHPEPETYTWICSLIEKGYTQSRIANDCNLSPATVSRYINRTPRKDGWSSVEEKLRERTRHLMVPTTDGSMLDLSTNVANVGTEAPRSCS